MGSGGRRGTSLLASVAELPAPPGLPDQPVRVGRERGRAAEQDPLGPGLRGAAVVQPGLRVAQRLELLDGEPPRVVQRARAAGSGWPMIVVAGGLMPAT